MKKLFVLILFTLFIKGYSQDSTLNWLIDFEEAKQNSAEQDKPILMYFTGSDWCLPCKKLKVDFFNTKKFLLKSQDFVLLKVDLPRRNDLITLEQKRKNMLLMQDYNRRSSFPTLVGLDADGKVLGDINGYSSKEGTNDYYTFLNKVLKKN